MVVTSSDSLDLLDKLDPMFSKNKRLSTYKNWPFDSDVNCNADRMAEAGFYCIGGEDEPDLVQCFICCKQLDGWEPNDDPWSEHVKHQPDCEFILLGKKDEMSVTLKEFYQLIKSHFIRQSMIKEENIIKSIKNEVDELTPQITGIMNEMKKARKN